MTKQGRKLSKEAIEHWPEIFGEIKLNTVPLRYLHTVTVMFNDGKNWDIRITSETKKNGWPAFEQGLGELIQNYQASIKSVEFKIDVVKVKKDIEKKTRLFLKNQTI